MSDGLARTLLELATKHAASGILLDTNVLLLFICSRVRPDLIGARRLQKYTQPDGTLLSDYVKRFDRVLTTPHVLTETSNLADGLLNQRQRTQLFQVLYPLFCGDEPNSFRRCCVDHRSADIGAFCQLGLTDACLLALVQSEVLLLTDDLPLYAATLRLGGDAINFTHMREAAGILS